MNVNKGYTGWSMSNRAVAAYENGEMPKSKWTKARMLEELDAYYIDNLTDISDEAVAYLRSLTKDELFSRFFMASSWHHTSKMFNMTDFYALDEDAADDYAMRPTRRTYLIVFGLGNHKVTCAKSFKTMARAERYLTDRSFKKMTFCYVRGNFMADVKFRHEKI